MIDFFLVYFILIDIIYLYVLNNLKGLKANNRRATDNKPSFKYNKRTSQLYRDHQAPTIKVLNNITVFIIFIIIL